jgi:cysteine desulfurase
MPSLARTSAVYLDHAAATPLLPEVLDAMLVHLRDEFANPSGVYRAGRDARRIVDDARDTLSVVLGCHPGEIVFTSGGTEADNLAILGVGGSLAPGRVIVSAIEHHAILRPAGMIGARIAPVTSQGVIDLEYLATMLDDEVALVSVMAVNNEIGTLQPLDVVIELLHQGAPGALMHTDAVQALSWCDLPSITGSADLISVSAHKVGGPKGVGALVVRERAREHLRPILYGGAQERDLRAGTENVAGIVGFATAARLTQERRTTTIERVGLLRDRFVDGLLQEIPAANEPISRELRHVGNAHLSFGGTNNEEFLMMLDLQGVAASAGSACASGALEPSHVLVAAGLSAEEARSCIRFTLGASTSAEEIDQAIVGVIAAYRQLMSAPQS